MIHDVLTPEECEISENEIWEFVNRMSKNEIDRENPETWNRWIALSKLGILGMTLEGFIRLTSII